MIVITTPTGQIGRQLLANVIGSEEPIRVIARDPGRLPPGARARVEVVAGSHGESAVVDRAFAGADAVFWLVPPDPHAESVAAAYVEFTRPAVEALVRHGVMRVVAVSALGRGTPLAEKAGYVTATFAMADLIARSGVGFRALALPSFMDNLLRQVEAIKNQGVFVSPISGDRKLPSCATSDIAAVAARLLLDDSWSGCADIPVLGPEELSFNDMAQIMSEVLARPVCFQQISAEAFKARMLERGVSEAMAQGQLEMALAKDAGLDNAEPRTPEATTPTGFRQWCEEVLKPAAMA
jgi:uncharacterized protein YbjT (DUF2867 family)